MTVIEAISKCIESPDYIYELEPSTFEQVVAELLASFGWEVSVTPPSRDGGYDILGITTDKSGLQTSWVIECKRYSQENKIGVEVVRQLVGVKHHIGVPNAVLVTSSSFTKGAQEISAARQDLQLVDREFLYRWLNSYSSPTESTYVSTKRFYSCFISHSSKDEVFAEQLAGKLKYAGVRIWYAPEDIMPGDKIYEQVKKAISNFDRLLVVLSEHSMNSNWVKTELASAISREQHEKKRILFPVSIVPIDSIKKWECFDSDTGIDIAKELRSYHIPDLSNWQNPTEFDKQLVAITSVLLEQSSPFLSDNIVQKLKQQLRSGTPHDIKEAALALGKLGSFAHGAVPSLKIALKNPSVYVRNAAAWALGEINTPEAQKILKRYEQQ